MKFINFQNISKLKINYQELKFDGCMVYSIFTYFYSIWKYPSFFYSCFKTEKNLTKFVGTVAWDRMKSEHAADSASVWHESCVI